MFVPRNLPEASLASDLDVTAEELVEIILLNMESRVKAGYRAGSRRRMKNMRKHPLVGVSVDIEDEELR